MSGSEGRGRQVWEAEGLELCEEVSLAGLRHQRGGAPGFGQERPHGRWCLAQDEVWGRVESPVRDGAGCPPSQQWARTPDEGVRVCSGSLGAVNSAPGPCESWAAA